MSAKLDLNLYLQDLEQVINMDSPTSYPEGNRKVIDFFAERFKSLGWCVEYLELDPAIGPCLKVCNRKADSYDVLMIGHVDTVLPVGTVAQRPFTIQGDMVTGPGVEDMKSGTLFMYYLAKYFTEHQLLDTANICILINTDEEIGSKYSRPTIEALARQSKCALVFESANPAGEMTKGRKGVGRYFVKFKGIAAHSGANPEKGASAVNEFLHWGSELIKLHNLAEGTSINIGVVHGGTAPNVVAEELDIQIDIRVTQMQPVQEIESLIKHLSENPKDPRVNIIVEGGITRPPMVPTAESEALCDLFIQTAQELGQPEAKFRMVGGGSDANLTAAVGTPSIDGLGSVGDNSHSPDEYTILSTYQPKFELLVESIKKIINK